LFILNVTFRSNSTSLDPASLY